MENATPKKEIELTKEYQPTIAKDCFDKFFDKTKQLNDEELGLKKQLQNLFKRVLGYQTANAQALALVASVDKIESQEDLNKIFAHVDLENLKLIDRLWLGNKNKINQGLSLKFEGENLSAATTQDLQSFVDNSGFSGSLVVSQNGVKHEAHSSNIAADTAFSIHSVGKLFTGVLAIEAMRRGILDEQKLREPVELDQSVLDALPTDIQEHLKKTTLHQLMTHKSGLQNYLPNYQKAVDEALKLGAEIPAIAQPQDYLKFAEAEIKQLPYVDERGNVVESHYSNLGSLLVGLAIENAYNKKHPNDLLSHDKILEKYVLAPAQVENFSANKPENAAANSRDLVAPHIAGSPAGGYWVDGNSLSNFGQWLCGQWKDGEFQRLTKEYGQEFYDPKAGTLAHGGSIESSCAYLTAFVEKGIVYAGVSNQPINTHAIGAAIETQVQSHYEELANSRVAQMGNLNAVDAARNFKDNPEIIKRYTVFDPQNVYRSAKEVLELHDVTGVDIMPRGNAINPNDIIGVGLICFRPERIAKQLTIASVNMRAKIDEASFPKIVDDVFDNYVAKEMESVVPQVNQMRAKIEKNVAEALRALQSNPEIDVEGNEVLAKTKEARDKIRQHVEGKIPSISEESINDAAAKYATDLIYNGSPEIFKLVEDAVEKGMGRAAKEGRYELLSVRQNNQRVAIAVAGGPASGKTQATEMALQSLGGPKDVMAFSTDQLRTLVSAGETGGPAFTDLEANLVFRQIIGKMDRAIKADVAPTILSEGTSLNPGAINHFLTGGAEVHASLISVPAEVALKRAGTRAASDKAADQGRSYSDEYLLGLHKQDGAVLPNIVNQLQGKNVRLSIFDNNVERGQSPELIGRINLQTMEMEIYNVQKLAELEQKGKIDPAQSKDQGIYSADDKLPENNISFLTEALKKFSVTFKDGEKGEEYATSKPGEKLTITNQALFASKQENPYERALTSPFLEEARGQKTFVERLGLQDRAPSKTASITLLVGTSTAGKSTIIKKIEEENKKLPPEQRMAWHFDGQDLADIRIAKKMDQVFLDLLKEDARFAIIQSSFSSPNEIEKLRNAIFRGSLTQGENKLSLQDASDYKQNVENFIAKTGGIYSREILDNLHSLVLGKRQEIMQEMQNVWETEIVDVNEFVFKEAIEASRQGRPSVLDLVPTDDNIFEKFEEFLARENFSCPVQVVIVHVAPKELKGRMRERNSNALQEGADPTDVRDTTSPFEQYGKIFAKAEAGSRVVAKVARSDFETAFSEFGKNRVEQDGVVLTTLDQAQKLMDRMGFEDNDLLEVAVKGNVGAVYQHDSVAATEKIAKKIMADATDKSFTPKQPHPVAKGFKELLQDKMAESGDGKSFVERLNLKAVARESQSLLKELSENRPKAGHVARMVKQLEQRTQDNGRVE